MRCYVPRLASISTGASYYVRCLVAFTALSAVPLSCYFLELTLSEIC
ncbi:hypothetical protein PF003_g8365 [Phytophthora fragariae]|nr:hypothetical protein PF003_g8365 [Phytophthora fragariae]